MKVELEQASGSVTLPFQDMKNRWNDKTSASFADDPKRLRVYTSRLLGAEPELVLHGGGNTSVKLPMEDFFGDSVDTLFVKGSGWDLATIEEEGFAPLRLDALLKLAALGTLSDSDMVEQQRIAMLDSKAPNASVEAILHAIIPLRYVDHTHANAVLAVTNTADGRERIRDLYGDRVIVIPYVMPGFALAKLVYEQTQGIDWRDYEGMILMNHGIFTFSDDGRESYERMIGLVSEAEQYLASNGAQRWATGEGAFDPMGLAQLRKLVGECRGQAVVTQADSSLRSAGFSRLANVSQIGTRGPLTPDHSIFAKRIPLVVSDDPQASLESYVSDYRSYFDRNAGEGLTCLDPAPRWAIWPGSGIVSFGSNPKNARVIGDIASHTSRVVQLSEALGGWAPLHESDVFEVEYWELEQAKLKTTKAKPALEGKVALVALASPKLSSQCESLFARAGAAVVVVDSNGPDPELRSAVERAVLQHGGVDLLLADIDTDSPCGIREELLARVVPFLDLGFDPSVVAIASGLPFKATDSLSGLFEKLQISIREPIRSCIVNSESGETLISASSTDLESTLPKLVMKLATL